MKQGHRSPHRLEQINKLKHFLSDWKTTQQCWSHLFDLIGNRSIPTSRQLAGSLNGDRRIEKRYIVADNQNQWRWKE